MQNTPPRSPTTTTLSAAGGLFLPSSTYDPSSSSAAAPGVYSSTNGIAKKESSPPLDVGSPLKKRRSSQHANGNALDRVLGVEPRALDANIFGKEGKESGLEGIREEGKGLFGSSSREENKSGEIFGGLLGKSRDDAEEDANGRKGSGRKGKEKEADGGEDVGMDEEL